MEPCINGQVAAIGAYFGQDFRGIVAGLLVEQLPDGGWNCEAANASTRSSFNTTICVLEGLFEYELAGGNSAEVTDARLRGHEYLLERRLFRRRSSGEVIERDRKGGASWTRFAFPTWWHYDVLWGLEYLRKAGVAPDERVAEPIELVASKRDSDGRWPLETRHPGQDAGRDKRERGSAQPAEHATRVTSVGLVFSTRLTPMHVVIPREEEFLERKFGAQYCRRLRSIVLPGAALFRRTRIGVRFNVAPLFVHDAAQFALHRFERVVDHLVERLVRAIVHLPFISNQLVAPRHGHIDAASVRVSFLMCVIGLFNGHITAVDVVAKFLESRRIIQNEIVDLVRLFQTPIRDLNRQLHD